MSLSHSSAGHREYQGEHGSETQLQGAWLVLTRVGWVIYTMLVMALTVASFPATFVYLHQVNSTFTGGPQLSPADVRVLQAHGISLDVYAWFSIASNLIPLLVSALIALVIFWRRSNDRVVLVASIALIAFPFSQSQPVAAAPLVLPLLSEIVLFCGDLCMGLFLYTFPQGRFIPRWSIMFMVGWAVWWAIAEFFPTLPPQFPIFALFGLCLLVSQVVFQVYRYRNVSTPLERQQTKWVIFGIAIGGGGFAAIFALLYAILPVFLHIHLSPLGHEIGLVPATLLYLFLPLSIGFAILRYRLWDIDIIINRALVYGTLTVGVVGGYALVVGGLGAIFEVRGSFVLSLLATGLIAVLFQPAHLRLQRAVNRLMYGERDEPYRVISRLGSRLEATLAPEAVLPTIVETVAQALKLPYAAITLKQDGEYVSATSYGRTAAELLRLPLAYQSEQMGELLLAPRAPGETFSAGDQSLLDDLARQAGIAVHAVRLTTDLQRLTKELQYSRTQLVTAREEERRRLRRDLHDGIGSVLASLNWGSGAIRNLLSRDPASAETLVVEQQKTIQAAIADIRRLVYDLRPPALDELGLVGAIRESALKQHKPAERDSTQGLYIDVAAPNALPALPAAVEVAAYRIVQEAFANVIHHSNARRCSIHLSCEQEFLRVEVSDDGTGLPVGYHAGVGLLSMRERAEELGGICEVSSAPGGGTRVQACFPLSRE